MIRRVVAPVMKVKVVARSLGQWWVRQDVRYYFRWRLANGFFAAVVLAGIVVPVAQQLFAAASYRLSADSLKLVGSTDQTLEKQLTYDVQKGLYQFNKDAVQADNTPVANLQSKVGTAQGGKNDKSLYALDVPTDLQKGVTYHDIDSQQSFTLTPEFKAGTGKSVAGHIVYPLTGGQQAVYSLKNNGLKEDILLPVHDPHPSFSFSYSLQLPKTLEARMLDDGSGGVGIYGADPSLYGNITYSSDHDRQLVEQARERSPKNYLVFGLPAPVIKAEDGHTAKGLTAHFVLKGNTVTVVTSRIPDLSYPLSVDPSVVVATTSSFLAGNNEDNIDFSTSNQITRTDLGGGSVQSWAASATSFNVGRIHAAEAAYNGYLYLLGGNDGTNNHNDVQFASISSTGTLGTWNYTHNSTNDGTTFVAGFTTARSGLRAAAYDGYLYLSGGTDGTNYFNDVQYTKLNSDGTVGAWQTTASFTTGRAYHAMVAYEGNMYINGGGIGTASTACNASSSTTCSDNQYAHIYANGQLSAWTATTSMSTARGLHGAVALNGYMYAMGGQSTYSLTDITTALSSVEYAPINADGSLGTWTATYTMFNARTDIAAYAINNYVCFVGAHVSIGSQVGANGNLCAATSPNGHLGVWQWAPYINSFRYGASVATFNGRVFMLGGTDGTTYFNTGEQGKAAGPGFIGGIQSAANDLSDDRYNLGSVAYNGYLYYLGGYDGTNYYGDVYYTALNAYGQGGAWTATTAFATTAASYRSAMAVVAYQGYLYIIGGTNTSTTNVVQYAALSSTGTVGTWTSSTYPLSVESLECAAYLGYMYCMGGSNGTNTVTNAYSASIGTNGALGTWTAVTALPQAMRGFSLAVANGNLYVIGGEAAPTSNTSYSTMYYTSASATGTLGATWNSAGTLYNAHAYGGVAVYDGYIILWGGHNVATNTSFQGVRYAPFNDDGTINTTTWYSGSYLYDYKYSFGYAMYNGFIYHVGGVSGLRHVQYQPIFNGGNGINTAFSSSTSFTNGRTGQASVAYNGYLYVLGGYGGTKGKTATYYNDVQYASLSSSGGVGTWATTSSFTNTRGYMAAAVSNGYLYLYGGYNGTTYYNDVQYALICTGSNSGTGGCGTTAGAVGTWTTSTAFTTARAYLSGAANNGYLYMLGGYNGTTYYNDVQYALICTGSNSGTGGCGTTAGAVGTWTTSTAFTTARRDLTATAYNNYLYVLGGSNGTTYYNDVQYAALTNGAVGTWLRAPNFITPRSTASVAVASGYMYITGGWNGTTYYNDVQTATILHNGSLSDWSPTGNTFTNTRSNLATATYNGYLYVLGGGNGTTYYADTQWAPLSVVPKTAHYSQLIDLGSYFAVTGITYTGSVPNATANVTYEVADDSGVLGAAATLGSITSTACSSSANGRYVLVKIVLDDSATLTTFPDVLATPAYVTGITVNYSVIHPAPNIRLHGGQALQTGDLRPFDTCIGT